MTTLKNRYAVVNVDKLNFRDGPNKMANVIGVLSNEYNLPIIKMYTDSWGQQWLYVVDVYGMEGWIHGNHAQIREY